MRAFLHDLGIGILVVVVVIVLVGSIGGFFAYMGHINPCNCQ